MILEAITVGALLYMATMFSRKVEKPTADVDIIILPLDPYRLSPHEIYQPDIIQKSSVQTLKDKQTMKDLPSNASPQDIALEMIRQLDAEYKKPPPRMGGKDGYYVGDYSHYIPIEMDA